VNVPRGRSISLPTGELLFSSKDSKDRVSVNVAKLYSGNGDSRIIFPFYM